MRALMSMLFLLSLTATGCATSWIKADAPLPKQPRPTLLTALTISSFAPQETGQQEPLSAETKSAIFMIQNQDLDDFGLAAEPMLQEAVFALGYELRTDRSRALRLGDSGLTRSAYMQSQHGIWTHPQASTSTFNGTWFDSSLVKVADKLRDAQTPQEHFASVELHVYETSDWMFWYAPIVSVDVRIINNRGKEVLDARFLGEGDSSFGAADRSATNLKRALERALDQMAYLEVESL